MYDTDDHDGDNFCNVQCDHHDGNVQCDHHLIGNDDRKHHDDGNIVRIHHHLEHTDFVGVYNGIDQIQNKEVAKEVFLTSFSLISSK